MLNAHVSASRFVHSSASVSIRQHTSVYAKCSRQRFALRPQLCIRQHLSASVSICQHTSAYVSIRQRIYLPDKRDGRGELILVTHLHVGYRVVKPRPAHLPRPPHKNKKINKKNRIAPPRSPARTYRKEKRIKNRTAPPGLGSTAYVSILQLKGLYDSLSAGSPARTSGKKILYSIIYNSICTYLGPKKKILQVLAVDAVYSSI